MGGIDHRGVQHLSGAVYHRHLAPHAVAGVQAHGHMPLHRRLHQQGPEVQGKLADGALVGPLGEHAADLPLQGGVQEAVIGVLGSGFDKLHGPGAGTHHRPAQQDHGRVPVGEDADLQKFLPLAPVDSQHLVALEPGHRLFKVVVQPIDAVLLLGCGGLQHALAQHQLTKGFADRCVVGDLLGDDVAGALEGVPGGFHALFGIDIRRGRLQGIGTVPPLGEEKLRQGRQPLFPGHGGAGAPLLLVGAVEILHLSQRGGLVDGGGELLCQLALALNGVFDLLPALFQVPEVLQPLLQGAQGGVVHGAVELFPVAGDEGDGVALVQQVYHVFDMLLRLGELPGEDLNDGFHSCSFLMGWEGGLASPPGPPVRLLSARLI